jgi:hypothetical protein
VIAARAARLLPLALLCACSGLPPGLHKVSADDAGVSFEFPTGEEEAAARQASLYCANLGRVAERQSLVPGPGSRTDAVFACR